MATARSIPTGNREKRAGSLAEQLYAQHRHRLLAIAGRNSASTDDAEEALHDAFIIFINRYDPDDEAPPLAWLTLTLKRRCWALYRHQRRDWAHNAAVNGKHRTPTETEDIEDLGLHPDELVEVAEKVAEMRNRLKVLKPDELEAMCLFAFGYRYQEICKLTGWTYTKVNRCITEGRDRLRNTA